MYKLLLDCVALLIFYLMQAHEH